MNGRAIDFEHWDCTLIKSNIFEKDSIPAEWKLTLNNYQKVLDALEIYNDPEINAEVTKYLNKRPSVSYLSCKKRFLSIFALDSESQQFKTPAQNIIEGLKEI